VTRILYVEDNDDNVYMLKMRLELLEGFEVLVAGNGETGCAQAIAQQPDVILMDLDLPVVDGREATRRLKSNPVTSRIPIIALTAHAMYGPSYADLYRRAAIYVDKIFKGAKPAELPIEQPMKFDFVINVRAAKAIGLAIPETFLVREVIE
jgi:CheY-like chemotaxis protein